MARVIRSGAKELTPFGEWVKIALVLNNTKQVDLAKKLGIPNQNVSRLCYGDVKKSSLTTMVINVLAKDENEKEECLTRFSDYIKAE